MARKAPLASLTGQRMLERHADSAPPRPEPRKQKTPPQDGTALRKRGSAGVWLRHEDSAEVKSQPTDPTTQEMRRTW